MDTMHRLMQVDPSVNYSYRSVTWAMMTPSPLSKVSIAFPTTAPIETAGSPLIAMPGTEELTRRSPTAIGPFSIETFTGTRPAIARTGRLSSH